MELFFVGNAMALKYKISFSNFFQIKPYEKEELLASAFESKIKKNGATIHMEKIKLFTEFNQARLYADSKSSKNAYPPIFSIEMDKPKDEKYIGAVTINYNRFIKNYHQEPIIVYYLVSKEQINVENITKAEFSGKIMPTVTFEKPQTRALISA